MFSCYKKNTTRTRRSKSAVCTAVNERPFGTRLMRRRSLICHALEHVLQDKLNERNIDETGYPRRQDYRFCADAPGSLWQFVTKIPYVGRYKASESLTSFFKDEGLTESETIIFNAMNENIMPNTNARDPSPNNSSSSKTGKNYLKTDASPVVEPSKRVPNRLLDNKHEDSSCNTSVNTKTSQHRSSKSSSPIVRKSRTCSRGDYSKSTATSQRKCCNMSVEKNKSNDSSEDLKTKIKDKKCSSVSTHSLFRKVPKKTSCNVDAKKESKKEAKKELVSASCNVEDKKEAKKETKRESKKELVSASCNVKAKKESKQESKKESKKELVSEIDQHLEMDTKEQIIETETKTNDANQATKNNDDIAFESDNETEFPDGLAFLNHVQEQISRLTNLAEKADNYIKTVRGMNGADECLGLLRSASGKANLLAKEKMKQFEGLCHQHINISPDEKYAVTLDDLRGFWDMVDIQVKEVDKLFNDIENIRLSNWHIKKPTSPTNHLSKSIEARKRSSHRR